jgi:hypothetical protein
VSFREFKDFFQQEFKGGDDMPRGGARVGAGRPKKPLQEKLLSGNPGKRELTVLKIGSAEPPSTATEQESEKPSNSKPLKDNNQTAAVKSDARQMPSYLDISAKEGGDVLPSAAEIFDYLFEFIAASGCENLVAPSLVEDFAFLRRSYLECEYMNKTLGRIAGGKRSPYVNMALDYQKAMMAVFNQIWLIVSRNSEEPYGEKNAFLEMLTNRNF